MTDAASHARAVEVDAFAVWSVKSSFRRYVASLADGVCAVSDDVRVLDPHGFLLRGRFHGTRAAFTWTAPSSVRFEGHGGLLAVELRALRLEVGPDSGALSVAAADGGPGRIPFAHAAIGARSGATFRIDLALTAGGAGLFADNYPVGAPLDPMHLMVEP
ncbi:hypothetical protein ARHIZOSPH14_28340 [Agromyces rhizosphaerae]|uniref:Htaa domain-containing protein n=1 Tax=Agromyces rhizosphaerae TaxID=88374 RepID=A0A9W6FSC2_9MICO|nr:hypothetical protein ARHIZOSPH14_28340 [Agromyces rhizosphaerae]